MKIGRNDPCPCGSGKKYKRCCGLRPQSASDPEIPAYLRTGTYLDEYQRFLRPVADYYQMLLEYDDDRRELAGAERDFQRDFMPGTPHGVPDSLFLSWFYFDFRYGKSGKTVCERFMESSRMKDLKEPGPTLIRSMSESYLTFYQVAGVSRDRLQFTELGTGRSWSVHRVGEPDDVKVEKGDIWYVRFVGPSEDAYIFSAPYIYLAEAKADLERAVKAQWEELAEFPGRPVATEKMFAEACKATVPLWADYFVNGPPSREAEEFVSHPHGEDGPAIVNRDGEVFRFCKVFFKIINKEGLRKKLSSLRNIDYDEQNDMWIWCKKSVPSKDFFGAISLGTITIKRGRLIAECNSETRALKLMNKLKRGLSGFISFEKIEAKDVSDMPPLSDEQRRKVEKEQEELNANPEIREVLRQYAENYYHSDWMAQKIPLFGGKTPTEAAKTDEGRAKVKAFLDDLEAMQNARPAEPFRVDVNGLRKRLGLIPEHTK